MALPQAIKGQATSLGRYDTSSPFSVARAKMAGIEGVKQAFDNTTATVSDIFKQAEADRHAQQLQDYENNQISYNDELNTEIVGLGAYVDTDSLPKSMYDSVPVVKVDDGNGNITEERKSQVVASSVVPQMRYEKAKAAAEAGASHIENDNLRQKAIEAQMRVVEQQYEKDKLWAIGQQQKENAIKQRQAIDRSLSLEQAVANVRASAMSPEQQEEEIFIQRQVWEKDGYSNIIMQGIHNNDPSDMIDTANWVGSDNYDGVLSTAERNNVVASLRAKSTQILNNNNAVSESYKYDIRSKAGAVLNEFGAGEDTDDNYEVAIAILDDNTARSNLTPEQEDKLVEYTRYSKELREYSLLMNPSEKRAIYDKVKDPELKELMRKQTEADARNTAKNPYARLAKVTGVSEARFPNKQAEGLNPDEYKGAVKQFIVDSKEQWDKAKSLGLPVPAISKTNAPEVMAYLDNAKPEDLLEFYGDISQSYTVDEAGQFFQELKVKRPEAKYLAGQIYNDGGQENIMTSERILNGDKRVKSGAIEEGQLNKWRDKISAEIGFVYADMPTDRKAIVDAVSGYVAMSKPEDLSGAWLSSDAGQLNDVIEEGLKKISPVVKVNGYKVAVPRGGEDTFKEYIGGSVESQAMYLYDNYDLHIDETVLGVNETSAEFVAKRLRSGNMEYESVGYGKYLIVNDLRQPLFDLNTGGPAVFTLGDM